MTLIGGKLPFSKEFVMSGGRPTGEDNRNLSEENKDKGGVKRDSGGIIQCG